MTDLNRKTVVPNFRTRTQRAPKRTLREGNDKHYLELIRALPSCVSGGKPCDPHHLTGGPASKERGVGQKATDQWCVPLTRAEHDDLHTLGSSLEREWFANRGVPDVYELARKLWKTRHLGSGRMKAIVEARGL